MATEDSTVEPAIEPETVPDQTVPDQTVPDQTVPSESPPSCDWPSLLSDLVAGRSLGRDRAATAVAEILAGRAEPTRIAGLLIGLAAKGEDADELAGMALAMRAAAEPLRVDEGAIDIVGMGGSAHRRAHALNISTMACFVASAAGAIVCKHGNRRASSTSGSSDFLQAIGVRIELDGERLERCVAEIGLGFAFAMVFHPAMRFAGPVRAQLGVPTTFNLLGPLAHPAGLRRQVIGVSSPERAELVAGALRELGATSSWVVCGHGGLDELALSGDSDLWVVTPEGIDHQVIRLAELGLTPVPASEVAGGDAERNAALFESMVAGERGPVRDIVVLNAAAGLVVAGVATDLADGVKRAAAAVDDGRVRVKVDELRAATERLVA